MIPYEKLCKALDRHKRKMRGEPLEEPLAVEENFQEQEVEEFAVDDDAIMEDPLMATDPGIMAEGDDEDYVEAGPLQLDESGDNEPPPPYPQTEDYEDIPPEFETNPAVEPAPEYPLDPEVESDAMGEPGVEEYQPEPPEQWPEPGAIPPGPPPTPPMQQDGEAKKTMFGMPAGPEPLPQVPETTQEIDVDSVDMIDDDLDPDPN